MDQPATNYGLRHGAVEVGPLPGEMGSGAKESRGELSVENALPLFELFAGSVHGGGWGTLRRRLERTRANLVFGQEHKLNLEQIAEASASMARIGWQSLWLPALNGKKEERARVLSS